MAQPEEPKARARIPTPRLALSIHHFTRLLAQRAEAEANGTPATVFEDARQAELVEVAFRAYAEWATRWPP